MRVFQDLLRVGEDKTERAKFCVKSVEEFRTSKEYKEAVDAEAYYNKENITIKNLIRLIYTDTGRAVQDTVSSDFRLRTMFFRRIVIQQVQYVLGNGLILKNPKNKEKLGKDFDFQLQSMAKRSMVEGRAFGYWNGEGLEVFGFAETEQGPGFCPLYDEKTGDLSAGIRFWTRAVGDKTVVRYTLYEVDGITEYKKLSGEEPEEIAPKHAYQLNTETTLAEGKKVVGGENYSALPIVQLYASDTHKSELVGLRESIDCYDFIKSGFANNIEDSSDFYWTLPDNGGMDDSDVAQFIQRLKRMKGALYESGQDKPEPHTLAVPVEARSTMLQQLRADIYEDAQLLDVKSLSAAQKTTQEIQAAYQAQDDKCADFEYYIIDFVDKILALVGIDDEGTLIWNKVVNQSEQTSMVLSASGTVSQECIIKHLPWLTPEEQDEEIKKLDETQIQQFNAGGIEPNDDDDDEEDDDDV